MEGVCLIARYKSFFLWSRKQYWMKIFCVHQTSTLIYEEITVSFEQHYLYRGIDSFVCLTVLVDWINFGKQLGGLGDLICRSQREKLYLWTYDTISLPKTKSPAFEKRWSLWSSKCLSLQMHGKLFLSNILSKIERASKSVLALVV